MNPVALGARALPLNDNPGNCYRCGNNVLAKEGEIYEGPLRLICSTCSLSEGFVYDGVAERIAAQPIVQDDGAELRLMPFQEADTKEIARFRAHLIGHQMGTGKCRHPSDLGLVNGTLIEAQETWSRYSTKAWFAGEGWWCKPSEPLFVNSINDDTGKIVRRPVKHLYRQRVKEALRRVRLDDGSVVTITKAHKLRGPEEWTKDLSVGDRICVPSKLLHEDGGLGFKEALLAGDAAGRAAPGTEGDRVRPEVMQAGPLAVGAFLSGFMLEAAVFKNGRTEFSSRSLVLLKEISVLFRRAGVWIRIEQRHGMWTASMVLAPDGPKGVQVHYAKVVEIEEIDHDGWVYDLEIKEHHNYVSEGALCHNTVISAMSVLRTDTGNLLFTPASVKRNWGREIRKWRPDLTVRFADSQDDWKENAPNIMRRPGHVLIGSYGVLPGTPCGGCRYLRKTLNALKKEKCPKGKRRYSGPIPNLCTHYSAAEVHPKTFEATIDGKARDIVYHKGCEGCYQTNPVPRVDAPALLLADEVHAFKNPNTLRTKNWRALREAIWAAGGYIYGLSGTPCEGKPPEFWEVLVSLGLERASFGCWNTYYRIFQAWYDNKKGSPLRRSPSGELKDELHTRLKRVMVRRLRKDVLKDLPPVVEQTIEVELDDKTIKAVNEAVHQMLAVRAAWNDVVSPSSPSRRLDNPYKQGLFTDEKARRKGLFDQRVEELFQERPWNTDEEIVNAVQEAMNTMDSMPSIEELSRIRSMLSQAKVAAVKEWMQGCEDQCEPTIVFSEHVKILRKLMDRPGWDCFDGSLSATQRDDMVQAFQSGGIEHGLGVSIRAGGEGITLVRARVCGFVDLSWNPAKVSQAIARLLRIGAEKHDSIVVVYFQANHVVDRLVLQTLKEKTGIMNSLDWSTDIEAETGSTA